VTLPASFTATLVDEWVRAGVTDAVVAPGSRSSPLALALLGDDRIRVHVRLDERSAGFFAVGLALSSCRPVVVVVTSGTAAAELHPAVVEADLAGVPLVVCTADRPPELRGVGAAQTIDQQHLFGRAVRHFADPGVPDEAGRRHWRSFASRLVAEATCGPRGPGPVHANLPFREPFGGRADDLPPARDGARPWHEVVTGDDASKAAVERLVREVGVARRGVVVAGRGAAVGDPTGAVTLAAAAGWPVLADSLAFPRRPGAGVVAAWDAIVRSATALTALRPEVVLRLGAPPASRALSAWVSVLTEGGASQVLVDPHGRFGDPGRAAGAVLAAAPGGLCRRATDAVARAGGRRGGWLEAWGAAEAAAQAAIDAVLGGFSQLTEPGIARHVVAGVPADSTLVVSSSMPIRDVDAWAALRDGAPVVYANRGANGIDGVVSTVLGAAAHRAPPGPRGPARTFGLVGDLAFFHDLSALVRGTHENVIDATIVVVDNSGGGIFSFLPYAEEVEPAVFERGFATPQSPDLGAVAEALGCRVTRVSSPGELVADLGDAEPPGVRVVIARTERGANAAVHAALETAVATAVGDALAGGR